MPKAIINWRMYKKNVGKSMRLKKMGKNHWKYTLLNWMKMIGKLV